jgi:hypothetical protein
MKTELVIDTINYPSISHFRFVDYPFAKCPNQLEVLVLTKFLELEPFKKIAQKKHKKKSTKEKKKKKDVSNIPSISYIENEESCKIVEVNYSYNK